MAGMKAVDPRVSFAELEQWPDDGRRYELYEGEVIVVPAPNWRHQRVSTNVFEILKEYERRSGGGVVLAPFDIILSDYDVLQPDVVFFGAAKRSQLDPSEGAHIVPDLAVEVLSRSTEARDRGRKMALLGRYGLPEYWLVDPVRKTLEIYTNHAGTLTQVAQFEPGDEVASPTLTGLTADTQRVFED